MTKEQALKICEAIEALTIVYEPLYYEDYDYLLDKYFRTAYSKVGQENLGVLLDTLVEAQRLYCNSKRYSVSSQKALKIFEKETKARFGSLLDFPFKEFKSGNEVLKYRKLCDAKNVKGTEKLHEFFNNLEFNDDVDIEETKYEFFVIPQLMADVDEYANVLSKKCKNLNKEKLFELYDEIVGILPRGFLRGYSFAEMNELIRNEIEKATYITKEEPKHKKNMSYSYVECLSLLTELEKTELYKLVDSDRVIELSINSEEVYVQILGYYGKDKAIIIYKDRMEMEYSLSLMKADIDSVPDISCRVSQIECLYNPEGFVSEEMEDLLQKRNLPPCPALVKLGYCRKPRLVNAKETNLIGAVLYELLCMMKMVDKKTITKNLGEGEYAVENTINQVYVYKDKVLFGEYEDDDIGFVYDKTKMAKLDNKLINKVKKCNTNHSIVIGTYICPMDTKEYPWYYQIFDEDDSKFIEMEALEISKNKDLGNIILRSLIKNNINPNNITFNNEITYDLLNEFAFYFDNVDVDDKCFLNNIYDDFIYGKNDDLDGGKYN